MSDLSKSTEKKTVKIGLMTKIKAFIKEGDEGKILRFLVREAEIMGRNIKSLEVKIANVKRDLASALASLDYDLQDANTALEESYIIADGSKIKTNSESDSFSTIYWRGIEQAEAGVITVEASIKNAKEEADKKIDSLNKQIAVLNKRLNTLVDETK